MKDKSVILVVDDQIQNIELLEAYLVPQGYNVVCALSGEEALRKISENNVDLILLDVIMPGMNGFEVIRRVKSDYPDQLIPIILVTALHGREDRVKGIEAGCDDFITKPVDKIELIARVHALLKVKAYYDLRSDYQNKLEAEVTERTEQLKNAYEDIKEASVETIHRLSAAAEFRDDDTGSHIRRIGQYSAAIAKKMCLSDEIVEVIQHASPMHDLGKIGIPDQILLKPAKLDSLEWEIMKQHSTIGAEILKCSNAEFIRVGEIIAKSHHERWDGSGYPNNLKGTQIPIESRITALADVFDALTSDRPYKKAFTVEKTLDIIREERGYQFDPEVVDAFLGIQEEILMIKSQCEKDGQKVFELPELRLLIQKYNQEQRGF